MSETIFDGYYIKVVKLGNGDFEITPNRRKDIEKECKDLFDLLENFIGNTSYRWVGFALTEMPSFATVLKENEEGIVIECGEIYGFNDYMLYDPIQELAEGNSIIFKKFK
jgi:hypothetical protein